jgi:hypothetical protein
MIKKPENRFLKRKNYVVKTISQFPEHIADGSEKILVEVDHKLKHVVGDLSGFQILYFDNLPFPTIGKDKTIYYDLENEISYVWDSNSIGYKVLGQNFSKIKIINTKPLN